MNSPKIAADKDFESPIFVRRNLWGNIQLKVRRAKSLRNLLAPVRAKPGQEPEYFRLV